MEPTDYEDQYADEPPRGGRILWGRVAILGLALLLMFVLGRCTAGAGAEDDDTEELEARVEQLLEDNADLEAQLDALQAGGSEPAEASGDEDEGEGDTGDSEDEGDEGDEEEAGDTGEAAGASNNDEPDPDDGVRTHGVVKGDYLYTLAERYYGDGAHWRVIADANGISRDDPTIRPGMVLEIPPDPEGD